MNRKGLDVYISIKAGVVGMQVPGNASPPCVVRYRESSLPTILSITLTPCKSMEGGLVFQRDSHSFHTGTGGLTDYS